MITAGTLAIDAAALADIEAVAAQSWPRECCGLLVGTFDAVAAIWSVSEIVLAPNTAPPDCLDRFEVAPKVLFATLRRVDGTGQSIIGHYHSHPNGRAVPSEIDASMRFYDDHAWLIAGLASASCRATFSAWRPVREPAGQPPFAELSIRVRTT